MRIIAINILSVMRALARIKNGEKEQRKPTWKMVIEQAFLLICLPMLDMTRCSAFEWQRLWPGRPSFYPTQRSRLRNGGKGRYIWSIIADAAHSVLVRYSGQNAER